LTAIEREEIFREPLYGTIEDRWHVYVHGYVARISDALAVELPAVRRILGDAAFASLAARYVVACPPGSYDLAHAGQRLSYFLESDPLTVDLPFLPDLARLERCIAAAFVAKDGAPLTWSVLQAMTPESVADLRLKLVPGTALVSSRFPLHLLWRARDASDDEVSIELAVAGETGVVVYRHGEVVRCEPLDADDAIVLSVALRGEATLAELAARVGMSPETFLLVFKRLVERGHFQTVRGPRWDAGYI